MLKRWLRILIAIFPATALAGPVTDSNTSVRALGMGNAYLGVVNDADSMFYNPAGLARVSGVNWRILDPRVGASGAEAYKDIQKLQDENDFEEAVGNLYGDSVWVGAGAKSALTFKGFGFAVYDTLDASLAINNPVYPNFDVNVVNDYGYVVGFGLPVLPVFHLGMNLKYIQRTGSRVPLGATFVGSLDPGVIEDEIMKKGTGYGLDLAANFRIPGPIETVFALVWKDVGGTSFKNKDDLPAPDSDKGDMSAGVAVNIDAAFMTVTPAIDFRYINREDVQLTKKLNFGIEIGLPLVDIRAGFHQGYYAAGAGVGLGPIQLDVATYGVELGEYAGQIEDRRYMLQATIEIGIPSLGFLGGESGGSGGKGGKGGSSGGFGGRRLKQRR